VIGIGLYSIAIDGREPGGILWFRTFGCARRALKRLSLGEKDVAVLARHCKGGGMKVLDERYGEWW